MTRQQAYEAREIARQNRHLEWIMPDPPLHPYVQCRTCGKTLDLFSVYQVYPGYPELFIEHVADWAREHKACASAS